MVPSGGYFLEKVVVAELNDKLLVQKIEDIFAAFGGIRAALPSKEQVFIKLNASCFSPDACTSPEILAALLSYFRDHGYDRLRVMDSSRQDLHTRLVFSALGYDGVCKRFGAKPVFLDERKTISIALDGESEPVEIPRVIYEEFIVRQKENIYLSLPKLKTHSITTVSLNIKGQQAFVRGIHRSRTHNHRLHYHLASLYRLIQPDFSLIDGTKALSGGHCPPSSLKDQTLIDTNTLIGGRDALAVDVVGSRVLGYELEEVKHLWLATEKKLGTGHPDEIQIVGDMTRFNQRYPHRTRESLPEDITWVEGKSRACEEGCKESTLWVVQLLYKDFGGQGGFSIIYGKGIDTEDLQNLQGDILVIGPCAVAEMRELLRRLYPDRRIFWIDEHVNFGRLFAYLSELMRVDRSCLIPLNRLKATWLKSQVWFNRMMTRLSLPGVN